jgi:hypothetical protein
MNNENNDSNPEDFFYDDGEAPTSGSAKKRSPVERVIVWTLIVGMVVVVGIEMVGKLGYDNGMAIMEERVENDRKPVKLADLKAELGFGASYTELIKVQGSANQYGLVEWFSLFKEYKLLITCTPEVEPVVVRFQSEVPERFQEMFAKLARGEDLPKVDPIPEQVADNAMGMNPNVNAPNIAGPGRNARPQRPGQQGRPQPGAMNAVTQFFKGASEAPKPKFSGRILPATPLAAVLDREETVTALNLTVDQKTAYDELNAQLGDKLVAAPSDRAGFLKVQAEIHAAKITALKGSLTPEQFQVLLKEYANWKGPFGLREPNIASHLKLSDEQIGQLNVAFSQWLDTPAIARTNAEPAALTKSLNFLTPEQRQAWDSLVGG